LNIENFFISKIYTDFIGDDAAIVGKWLYSKDAFFENVHFKKEWLSYKQVAKKAMLVNISDAIAMNAVPKYALLSVAMPKKVTKYQAKALAEGFNEVAKAYGVTIIGGDTIANEKLDITVTIISKTNKPLLRKGLKNGDFLAYTGTLGKSAKDLQRLLRGGKLHKQSKFIDITLRQQFIRRSIRYLHCGMDISDGLFSDLEKLSKMNNLGFSFLKKIPKQQGCSGEEYEMLIGFDKRHKKAIIRQAKRTRTPLSIFAVAQRKRYTNTCKGHHF
jgi:thiamine-monophosphate kinase